MNSKLPITEILNRLSEQSSFKENLSFNNLVNAHKEIEDAESDRKLKEYILKRLWWLICGENISLICLLLFQGMGHIPFTHFNFSLNEGALSIFVSGCVLHTYYLLRRIVMHHFPVKNKTATEIATN